MAPEGLVVLAISQDADSPAYMRFISERHLGFLTVRRPDKSIQVIYGAIQIPQTFLIDKEGYDPSKSHIELGLGLAGGHSKDPIGALR